ncbi:LysM peptidoglycan-binding domain-containing protein [Stenotrophomonas sp. W1S232]|jgi:nucleoid-associated protein YgaU|uniref:LysM peptidoglycan-binding domain-containing protein n=1 Tax=Stenotrophomonas koreensis TaxID=266128 RepID=A0A7W3V0H7_9GAMM|nr:LysM peptidoglycan-binding domain-containing protein [Stenotrophomonas koreensis]MBB1117248.1 LysM peptidoglycan-binding domain-containing protein [Stenotrophomonas koreensis]
MLSQFRTVAAAAMLTVAAYAAAAQVNEGHPTTYVVQKGDTLWDISARFLKKPWLWPEIWQANPQVQNPHLIYPGDVLSLAYLDRVVAQPGPRQEAPINAIPLSQVEPFLKDLQVVDSFEHLPRVAGLEDNRLRASAGQKAYVLGLDGAQVGQRYAVVRPSVRYALPETTVDLDARGKHVAGAGSLWANYVPTSSRNEALGFELVKVNVGTITALPDGRVEVATLALEDSGREVRAGDRLVPVQAQPYDLQFIPHPPAAQTLGTDLRVLAVTDMFTSGGSRDVIAISAGARDGVDNGTVFSIWRDGSHVSNRHDHPGSSRMDDSLRNGAGRVTLPDEYASHAMVFRTYDKVSYALVMEGSKPTRVGYSLKHPDAQ